MSSRPPSPPMNKNLKYFTNSLERLQSVRDEMADWSSGFTLLDTFETYFDSHVDLIQRKLQKHGDRLKMKAKIPELSGDLLAENLDREIKNFKHKISKRMTTLSNEWHSAKVVRTRDKISFFFGVMSVLFSALMFGMAPQWVHIAYTVQGLYLLPLRAYTYKKRAWHYFMFDMCYFATFLNFLFIWFLPSSPSLFVSCYCLSMGSLASAVITWRNSLVFHDQDKVTSLFVHIYAPFTFTVIRHFYPNAEARFPALVQLPHLDPIRALALSGGLYLIWQLLYWKFLLVDRRDKIESGQRTTSFSWMLNDKRSAIGRALSNIPIAYRPMAFMTGQLFYTLLTEVPAVFVLYDSSFWSGIFLIFMFSVSVWNGGGYYIEVFGRKFERELETLRRELAEATARSGSMDGTSRSPSDGDLFSLASSPVSSESSLPDVEPTETLAASITKKQQ
ncbi:hypothetical protein CPB85DRAFT_1302844 [Mucidula mucida]|nr:hypothetical protein CPB85DRAFT_1302844 [Mucidula mucida]